MDDLKKIKKHYGEEMMHLCRELFPTLLEQENLLFKHLNNSFAHSKFLAADIIENNYETEFQTYIYSLVDDENDYRDTNKTPFELLNEAGYNLYECKTEEEVETFRKYYIPREELCTFNEYRLKKCYIFFAVKKNVHEIKRKNFKNPERQDEYGTSVISIQFSKGSINTLSIKNRYNHTVSNPDATFSNNLENIIPGLTKSFEKFYHLNINQNYQISFDSLDYVKASDGKYYKYFLELGNIYYGPDNIIVDNFEIKSEYLEKEKYLIIDYFVIDLVNKKITLYDERLEDSFPDGLKDIKNIEITKEGDNKLITITQKNNNMAYIKINKYNQIISYRNDFLEKIKDDFLVNNDTLEELILPNVEVIGNRFIGSNEILSVLELPNVKLIGNNFLLLNKLLQKIEFPKLIEVGNEFLFCNEDINEVNLPNLEKVGNDFLHENTNLTNLKLLKLVSAGSDFLFFNTKLNQLQLPLLNNVRSRFLYCNKELTEIYLPNLQEVEQYFFFCNKSITTLYIPKLLENNNDIIFENEYLNKLIEDNIIKNKDSKSK